MKKSVLDDEEKDILESYEDGEWFRSRMQKKKLASSSSAQRTR